MYVAGAAFHKYAMQIFGIDVLYQRIAPHLLFSMPSKLSFGVNDVFRHNDDTKSHEPPSFF